ncbi:cytokine receptor family member B12 [Labeo rohita]|uniref:cytokine receptor family member B12 n=1 Tax=Labeo rohita TaxID=84645 RepID=UPI0021E25652|nr:cytokine receptor family member B12 [Labeo rohita]
MTHFLACMFTLLQLCLTTSKAILSPPKNLTVEILDFKATVEWLPGQGNPPDTRYTLEFITAQKMAGGKWNRSANCTNIAVLKCELTFDWQPNELHWNYFVRVQATFKGTSSNWTTTTKSFQPYGDTRLSSPDVKISAEQKSITINFSHWLESKPEVKPLEYLLYLFENSPAEESKFVALISSSESPYIFHDMPSGKNYCVSVSASHQQVLKSNSFNTTKCLFLSDSARSFVLLLCIVAMLLIAFSTAIVFLFGCFHHMRLINKIYQKPDSLIVISKPIWVLKQNPVVTQPITVAHPKEDNSEDYFSSSEEDYKDGPLLYHSRENLTSLMASVDPPEQAEEAKTYNQYTLANDTVDSDENVISEKDDDSMHPDSESGSFCACTSKCSGLSRTLETVTVNMSVNSEIDGYCAEETLPCSSGSDCEREVLAEEEEEEEDFFFPDSFSDSGYEPRHLYL